MTTEPVLGKSKAHVKGKSSYSMSQAVHNTTHMVVSGPLGYSGGKTHAPSMSEPRPAQPVKALAQMVAELAGMHKDQPAMHRKQLKELQPHTEGQTKVLENLVTRSGS